VHWLHGIAPFLRRADAAFALSPGQALRSLLQFSVSCRLFLACPALNLPPTRLLTSALPNSEPSPSKPRCSSSCSSPLRQTPMPKTSTGLSWSSLWLCSGLLGITRYGARRNTQGRLLPFGNRIFDLVMEAGNAEGVVTKNQCVARMHNVISTRVQRA
jgi:hypothetical protein